MSVMMPSLSQPPLAQSQKPQYGSEIEYIARQSVANSMARSARTRGLIRAFVRSANQQARAMERNSPPVGLNAGTGRGNRGLGVGTIKGKGPGLQGPIRPNAKIVSIRDGQGHTVQVNKSVAPEFKAFLRALKRTGYDIDSIGGYANRNIAGTSTRSLHSYGLAIDINPSSNPVYYGRRGGMRENLPKGIGRLAKRYGITWGGNWNGPKYDPMHFSFPYFGTK